MVEDARCTVCLSVCLFSSSVSLALHPIDQFASQLSIYICCLGICVDIVRTARVQSAASGILLQSTVRHYSAEFRLLAAAETRLLFFFFFFVFSLSAWHCTVPSDWWRAVTSLSTVMLSGHGLVLTVGTTCVYLIHYYHCSLSHTRQPPGNGPA